MTSELHDLATTQEFQRYLNREPSLIQRKSLNVSELFIFGTFNLRFRMRARVSSRQRIYRRPTSDGTIGCRSSRPGMLGVCRRAGRLTRRSWKTYTATRHRSSEHHSKNPPSTQPATAKSTCPLTKVQAKSPTSATNSSPR